MRFLAWLGCALAPLGAADIAGSELLGPVLSPGLAARAPAGASVDFAGTLAARRGLAAGAVSLAIVFVRPEEAAPTGPAGVACAPFPFARAAAVVAVHRSNPVGQIDLPSLAGVFSRETLNGAGNWNELPGGGRSDLITAAIHSPDGSYVRELFQGLVLERKSFKDGVRLETPVLQVRETLASVSGALVLLPFPAAGDARLLQVADGRPGRSPTAYSPTEMNIYTGDYPLSLPLVLYVREDRRAAYAPVIRWLLSDEVSASLQNRGLTPTPREVRGRLLQRLDTR
jgi:ABC-type phosphate transport system substrate-binding protein